MDTAKTWVRVMRGGDRSALDRILHGNVSFSTAWASRLLTGRPAVAFAVLQVARVLENYTAVKVLRGPRHQLAVVYGASLGGLAIEGCDLLETGLDERIVSIEQHMRPLGAMQVFAERLSRVRHGVPQQSGPAA